MKWEATTDGETIEITDENGRIVADYVPQDAAPLIAAAPELLAALKAFIGDKPVKWGYYAAHNSMDDAIREAARQAIAKAEGQV